MLKVAFIGLGNMGGGMAARLRQAGFPLTVYNRTRAKAGPAAHRGCWSARSRGAVSTAVRGALDGGFSINGTTVSGALRVTAFADGDAGIATGLAAGTQEPGRIIEYRPVQIVASIRPR